MKQSFGDCVFDRDTRELTRRNASVHCGPKLLALLELLLDAAPRVVKKEEIHKDVWPGTFVADATLTSLVAELRGAIGDEAKTPRLVRTVHGYGYAFIGEVRDLRPVSTSRGGRGMFQLLVGQREIPLASGQNIVGRSVDADVLVDDVGVSRHHARITIDARGAMLEDLASKNGTTLDGCPVQGPTPLSDGSLIVIGATALRLRIVATGAPTRTVAAGATKGN